MDIDEPISVSLGDLRVKAEARVRSGAYGSIDAVLRAGLHALDREEAEHALPFCVRQALDEPGPPLPAEQVFTELRARHAGRVVRAGSEGDRDV